MREVSFRYPLIMKLEITTRMYVDERFPLDRVKQEIFNDFWEVFRGNEKHGTYRNVGIFLDRKIIETQEEWEECLKTNRIFNVIFQKSPHGV
ncbi:MAG: hypothetical protein H7A38_00115 [Chlamydiales bacterium]|nr:hypothetical protein [Chlamydiales bacterium]